ncbi:MAG: MalM family protein [Psychromonas sp.]
MTFKTPTLFLLMSFILAGCSSSLLQSPIDKYSDAFMPPSEASEVLAQKKACCENINQLNFTDISNDDTLYLPFIEEAQVYNFAEGKSFVQAYKLNNNATKIKLTVSGLINQTALQPQVMLLDRNFKVTRTISSDKFIYRKPALLNGDELFTELTIYRPQLNNVLNETYLVFYTTDAAVASTTTIQHPAKAYAIAHGNAAPNVADPIVEHSAMGIIKLYVDFEETQDDVDDTYIPAAVVPASELALSTEEDFNKAIVEAVEAQQIEQALSLVEQAEAAGSKTAKDTFIKTLKK